MQKLISRLLLAMSVIFGGTSIAQAQVDNSSQAPIQGVVRVKMQKPVAKRLGSSDFRAAKGKALTVGVEALDAKLKAIKGHSLKKVFPCPPGREAAHAAFGLDQWYEIQFDESVNPLEAMRILGETAGVEKAIVRRPIQLFDDGKAIVADELPKAKASAQMPFNDPRLSAQWHYHNDGSIAQGMPGADINLFEAWKTNTGSPNVIVAVIDGGIDVNHEDLKANLWVNPGEIPGNGIDDDGNGYVDDVNGYNFCAKEGAIAPHQHGTHVAGTIAAVNNNGIGVCGVAGGNGSPDSGVRLMSVQVFDSRSGTGDPDVAAAIVYAADMGATIANNSWGWTGGYVEEDVLDAIRYFTQHAASENMRGGLCIFAAGNDGATGDVFPACMPEVLAVGAMGHDGRVVSYSNYGEWVDVTAPGGLLDFSTYEGVLSTLPDNKYGYLEGTSMACPHVTGIAALVLSEHGSSTMTNQSLRTQLETSVNDLYSIKGNEDKVGLLGSGYSDAAKALQWGDGTAPSAPADFTAMPAQDNITVQWTIPETYDKNVNHHILYYSTSPFAADNLAGTKSVVIDTKYASSGDLFTYELTGLEPITTYYLAIVAVDRWGNASPMTPVISASTNRGPLMTVDLGGSSSLRLTSDASTRIPSTTFSIGNSDEGLLKWSAYTRSRRHSISSYSLSAAAIPTGRYNGRIGIQPCSQNSVAQASDFVVDDYPRDFANHSSIFAFIGDNNKELPNSMAQLFYVDPDKYPEGFNLTHLNIEGSHGEAPLIEIYQGNGVMNDATRLLSWESDFSFMYNTSIAIPEQFFFEPGESFYIVAHFRAPQPELYPLGLGILKEGASNAQAYMSNDLGQTWVLLSTALEGSDYENRGYDYCWAITARSANPDFSALMTLTPAEGQVAGGESCQVNVAVDGSKLINGTYNANIHFRTNESEANSITVPVTINVSGHQPEVIFNKVVDFGSLIIGQSKTIDVEVFNRGYGMFAGEYGQLSSQQISSTSDQFQGPEYLPNGFPARSTTSFAITFTPTRAGSHSGQIIFTDKDGKQVKVMVQGTATESAKIAFEPADGIQAGDLEVGGEAKEVTFSIKNEGKYPLQFCMPKFSDETIEGLQSASNHRFGYTWQSNINGSDAAQYQPMTDLTDCVNVASQFSDNVYWTKAIDLGFDFPYFGKTYDNIYISSLGGLAIEPYLDGLIYPPIDDKHDYVRNTGMISAFGASQLMMGPDSKVEYAKQDGNFVVNYRNVLALVYDKDYTPVSFHIILKPTGDIEFHYDDIYPESLFQESAGLFVALCDPDNVDHLVITSANLADGYWVDPSEWTTVGQLHKQFVSGTTVHFSAPKPNMITDIAPVVGIIAPGEETQVSVTLQASDEMYAGPTYNDVAIMTNDPANPAANVRINANITGDLNPVLNVANTDIDFGEVFRTAVVSRPVAVKNSGKADLTISAVEAVNSKFSVSFSEPVIVPAGQAKDIMVTIPSVVEGPVADVIRITTSAGIAEVNVKGTVIGCPAIDLSYATVEQTINSGDIVPIPLTISNTGDAPLGYTVTPGNFIDYAPLFNDDSQVEYKYTASVDNPDAKIQWIDNTADAVHHDLGYFMDHSYFEVELPFEFPFFDSKYSKIYVYNSGLVTFDQRPDDSTWPEPPAEFPAGSVFTNAIAPYWGLHSMDQTLTAGIYYSADQEQAVLTFIEYGNSLNNGVDYQLVLHKDGTFSYAYHAASETAIIYSVFGAAGLIGPDGKTGVNLPERFIKFGESVSFSPIVRNTLPAGQNVAVDLRLNGQRLAGQYDTQITIDTDIPAAEPVIIPVSMTVTGEPDPVFPADIVSEHVAGYASTDYNDFWIQNGFAYYETVEIANNGTAAFTIENIDFLSYMFVDPDPVWGGEFPAFTLWYYGQTEDWMTGEMISQWMPYYGGPITVGSEPVRFIIPMEPYSGLSSTPGSYENTLHLYLSGLGDTTEKDIKVTFVVTEAPCVTLDKEEIRVSNAGDNTVTTEKVTISNQGAYKLVYDFYLDPTGQGESVEIPGGGDDPGVDPLPLADVKAQQPEALNLQPVKAAASKEVAPMATGKNDNYLDTPAQGSYTDYLYWEAMPANQGQAYMFGTGDTFSPITAATEYVGPENGFNISQVYFMMCPYGLGGKTVKVKIMNGDISLQQDILGEGSYTIPENINDTHQPGALALAIAHLKRPVYINPGQEFYIAIEFPAGSTAPLALVSKLQEMVPGRYLCYGEKFGGWVDIAEAFNDQYGSVGFVCTALQTVEGRPWAELVTSPASGVIEPSQSADIEVSLSAASAPKDRDNKAMLVIHTNDPQQPIVNFPIFLDRNAAPAISAPGETILVNEGETAEIEIIVTEPEGDNFAIRVDDAHPAKIATIASVEKIDPAEDCTINEFDPENHFYEVLGSQAGVKVKVALAPDHGHAGDYSFTVTALDADNHDSDALVNYSVARVNRAPVCQGEQSITIEVGNVSTPFNLADMFSDPDGDDLTYEIKPIVNPIFKSGIVDMYQSGSSLLFQALKTGDAAYNITATDPDGASASGRLIIKVSEVSGIDHVSLDASTSVYPNPVVDILRVTTDFDALNANYAIYNAAGALMIHETADAVAGQAHEINVGSLPSGIYVLRLEAAASAASWVIIKD